MPTLRQLSFTLPLLSFIACGGTTIVAPGGSDSGQPGSDSGLSPSCPASIPASGTSCTGRLQCEYGTDPNAECDTVATCDSGAWSLQPPSTMGCGTTNAPTCPTSFSSLDGTDCPTLGLSCLYVEARCTCSPSDCLGGPCRANPDGGLLPPVWVCDLPPQGCPVPRPRIGSACAEAGQSCDYGACTGGVGLECMSGTWQESGVACPASAGAP